MGLSNIWGAFSQKISSLHAGVFRGERSKNDVLYIESFRENTSSIILSTLAISILSLALPITTLQVYDRILVNKGTGTIVVLIVGVVVAIMLETMLRIARNYVLTRSGAAYEHRMMVRFVDHFINVSANNTRKGGVGEFLHNLSTLARLREFYTGQQLVTFVELMFVPVYLVLLTYISGILVLIPICILILFGAITAFNGSQHKFYLKKLEDADDKRFNFLVEALEGIHALKAFGFEKMFSRRYEHMEAASARAHYDLSCHVSMTHNSGGLFANIMVIAVITFGAGMVLSGGMTNGALIAALLLSGRLMQPIQKGLSLWTRYQAFKITQANIQKILAGEKTETLTRNNAYVRESEGNLELKNVSFVCENTGKTIIEDASFEMKRGESLLITGVHGAGKSVLMKLIAGTLTPTSGKVILDREDIRTYEARERVKHVGHLVTSPSLIRGSIRHNISSFGLADPVKVNQVARILGVDAEVAKLPGGFDTIVTGNYSDAIPPALSQRIAITRALAEKPRIILFDNADRSMDFEGYQTVYKLLARLKSQVTMIICSDDENLRALTDRHYHLVNGRLEAGGRQRQVQSFTNLKEYG